MQTGRWRWIAISVFVISSLLNYLDRQLLAAGAPSIKSEFHLSNAQFGQDDAMSSGFGLVMKALAEGSDHEFFNNEVLFSVEKSGFAGLGRFDQAVLCQFQA